MVSKPQYGWTYYLAGHPVYGPFTVLPFKVHDVWNEHGEDWAAMGNLDVSAVPMKQRGLVDRRQLRSHALVEKEQLYSSYGRAAEALKKRLLKEIETRQEALALVLGALS